MPLDVAPGPSSGESPAVEGERRRTCYSWQRTGMCRLGSMCRNLHDREHAYVPPDYTHRVWSHMQASTSSRAAEPAVPFSVMSYNVLADELAHAHAKELYLAVPEHCLAWQSRGPKLLSELIHWRPDIVCLQEVDRPADFTQSLELLGYAWKYAARTGDRPDGCLTLWKADKFEMLTRDTIEMCQHGLKDNVALIVVLRLLDWRPQAAAPCIAVANTHLLFNPKRGDIKLGQVGLIMRRISAICAEVGIDPLGVFTGDFNSTPPSGVCSFVRTGELDCLMEDRRTLSGQLESKEAGLMAQKRRQSFEHARTDIPRRGSSLDGPHRAHRNGAVQFQYNMPLQCQMHWQQPPPLTIGNGMATARPPLLLPLAHCSSDPKIASMAAGLKDVRHSGPVGLPGQAPLYPYPDAFGQVAWSHIPPPEAIKRQPFYHEPMVVEEARPPPPLPSDGLLRSISFATRQANATTWTAEQLRAAVGSGAGVGPQRPPRPSDVWLAEQPLPMASAYESVLGTEPAYTSCHSKFIGTVDYLWFTPQDSAEEASSEVVKISLAANLDYLSSAASKGLALHQPCIDTETSSVLIFKHRFSTQNGRVECDPRFAEAGEILQAGELRLTPARVLLPPPLESLDCGLPSPAWPSDHISLMAEFILAAEPLSSHGSTGRDLGAAASSKRQQAAVCDATDVIPRCIAQLHEHFSA